MSVRGICVAALLCACQLPAAEGGDDTPLPSSSVCGDAFVGANEICDDGNTDSGDGCSDNCMSDESCGNGIVDASERCDDSNAIGGDGCNADCTSDESCGNGIVDAINGETCDDANLIAGDGCSANCQSNESCGNNVADPTEQCDEGGGFTATCDPDCTRPTCGDGIRNTAANEQCDSSGVNTAACDANCTLPACGDNTFNPAAGEQCDNGGTNTAGCDPDCTLPVCGDGRVNPAANEQCDDVNGSSNDACIACRNAFCGDGHHYFGVEQCDYAIHAGCNTSCNWDPVTYTIERAQLYGVSACADEANVYDPCLGNEIGFTWIDSAPFQPSQVVVEINFGVDCTTYLDNVTTYYDRATYLNGAYAGTYGIQTGYEYCSCAPPTKYLGLDVGGATGAYVRGGQNTFALPSYPNSQAYCTGFSDFGGGYARVHVYP